MSGDRARNMPERPCGTALATRKRAIASHGMANAVFSCMKPVLLLAFLALGPTLAEQFPVVPRTASDVVAQRSGIAPPAAPREAERVWLGGR